MASIKLTSDGGKLVVDLFLPARGVERLSLDEARALAVEMSRAVQHADRLPAIHERHVDLLASCELCVAEAGNQPDRLVQDDDDDV